MFINEKVDTPIEIHYLIQQIEEKASNGKMAGQKKFSVEYQN